MIEIIRQRTWIKNLSDYWDFLVARLSIGFVKSNNSNSLIIVEIILNRELAANSRQDVKISGSGSNPHGTFSKNYFLAFPGLGLSIFSRVVEILFN